MLRLDWNIVFNIVNLLILYLLMKRFLFKPVNTILEKRQAEVESRFAQADAKEARAAESCEKYEALLRDAKEEQKKIAAQARSEAVKEYDSIVEDAKRTADAVVENAKENAVKEKNAILKQADTQIREMVMTAAAKMAGAFAGAENDSRLYDSFLEHIGRHDAG